MVWQLNPLSSGEINRLRVAINGLSETDAISVAEYANYTEMRDVEDHPPSILTP